MGSGHAGAARGWNHSAHYHDLMLSTVPRPCRRALDIGCGLGGFARRLTEVADHVDALDRDPAALGRAREIASGPRGPSFVEADFVTWQSAHRYDFVSMIATLHHLPFDGALIKASDLLEPGGVIAVLGLDRARSLTHRVTRSLLAYPVSRYYRLRRGEAEVGAALIDPTMTLDEIRTAAARLLPGALIRPRLLRRYTLTWTKPEPGS